MIRESSTSASPNRNSITIKTTGLTWLDKLYQILIICAFPVGVLFVIYLSGPRPPVNVPLQLAEVVVVLAVVDFALEEITSVRRITMDSEGVRFRFLIHTEVRQWGDLQPGTESPEHSGWWVVSRRREGKPSRQRGYRITLPQARAMLSHPSCPKWELKPAVRAALGVAESIT